MLPNTETPTPLVVSPTVACASWRELNLVVWRAASTAAELQRIMAAQRGQMAQLRGRKMAVLTVMDASALTLPDAKMRALIDEHRRASQSTLKAEVVVLPSGLVAATVRSVIAGITLVHRPAYPTRVVSQLSEGLEFLTTVLEPVEQRPATLSQLRAVVDSVRAAT